MPKISVCVPTYNRGFIIKETIESVLKQEFEDFELLVCIDGSKDDTKEILSQFNDPRLKIFENKENIGYIPTMHRLTELSVTNWIQFLSDDDILEPDFLKKSWDVIKENPEIGFVVSGNNFIDESGRFIYKVKKKYINRGDWNTHFDDVIIFPKKEMLGNFTMMSVAMLGGKYEEILPTAFPNHIFNKEILISIGGSDSELFYNHDTLLVSQVSVIAPCAYIDKPLINYRIHSKNLSASAGNSTEFVRQYFLFIRKFLNFLSQRGINIPDIDFRLKKSFEMAFFSWNGHLIRIASKNKSLFKQWSNVIENVIIFFKETPSAKKNFRNWFIVLIAIIIPAFFIEKIGLFYFRFLRK